MKKLYTRNIHSEITQNKTLVDDMREVLAEFSHGTLLKITKLDFGINKKRWRKWFTTNKESLNPVVLEERPFG